MLLVRDHAALGPGTIEWIDVLNKWCRFSSDGSRVIESGEQFNERVVCAMVRFGDSLVTVELSQLINLAQAEGYDALRPGDLVVYGKKRQARGIVVEVKPRRRMRNGITAVQNSIIVLQGGTRKRLHPCQDITMIQRACDYLHYE